MQPMKMGASRCQCGHDRVREVRPTLNLVKVRQALEADPRGRLCEVLAGALEHTELLERGDRGEGRERSFEHEPLEVGAALSHEREPLVADAGRSRQLAKPRTAAQRL